MELSEIIYISNFTADLLRHLPNDQFVLGAAKLGTDQDFIDTAGQIENDGPGAATAFVGAHALGHETYAAVRAMGLGKAVQIDLGRDKAVEFVMAAPEGIDENPALMVANSGIEADGRFAVQTYSVCHQAVAIPAVELLDHEEIFAFLLDIFNAFRESREKFYRYLFIYELHYALPVKN